MQVEPRVIPVLLMAEGRFVKTRRFSDPVYVGAPVNVLSIFNEFVVDEIEFGGTGEVADREDRAQRLFEAGDVIDLLVRAQELFVALALHLDQVRHVDDFVDVAEDLADAPLRGARCLGMGGLVLRGLRLGSHKGALAFF